MVTILPERRRVGFVVNPIAGMGGRVGLKGTDDAVAAAVERGAEPTAHLRADQTLQELRTLLDVGRSEAARATEIEWLTCTGPMGANPLRCAGFDRLTICYEPSTTTSAIDTKQAVRCFVDQGAELVVFCGGDGTARDVRAEAGSAIPILGIPAGVKMFSGVFGVSPTRTAEILAGWLRGDVGLAEVDVLDIDECAYRSGELAVHLHATALTPFESSLTQAAKALIVEAGERDVCTDIADDLIERFETEPNTLVVLGPGSTVAAIGRRLGIDKTLLGFDAVVDSQLVGADLDERALLQLLAEHRRAVLVLSPIGAQGFVLGRGNLQVSPQVLRRIGPNSLLVVATPAKLSRTPMLRFDTGDPELDRELVADGYIPVLTGFHRSRLVEVAA
ncbi:MAG: ATP-NAD kinase family protein [Acidimicrobiales bacterium]